MCRLLFLVFFFFSSRRRHTRSLCYWSSDVCSSDLPNRGRYTGSKKRSCARKSKRQGSSWPNKAISCAIRQTRATRTRPILHNPKTSSSSNSSSPKFERKRHPERCSPRMFEHHANVALKLEAQEL